MPDATGLELLATEVRESLGDDAVTGTLFFRDAATLEIDPGRVREVIAYLRDDAGEPYDRLMSVHGVDYMPEEPRLGVLYELLSMARAERLTVKTRVGTDDPVVPSVTELFATADFQEREVFDMFGVRFEGHHDLRRILMPEDYEGYPQRRDFPMGGEPVIFTFNEHQLPRWYD